MDIKDDNLKNSVDRIRDYVAKFDNDPKTENKLKVSHELQHLYTLLNIYEEKTEA